MSSEERQEQQTNQTQQNENSIHFSSKVKSIANSGNNGITPSRAQSSPRSDNPTNQSGVVEGVPLQSQEKTPKETTPPSKRRRQERIVNTSQTVQAKNISKGRTGVVFGIAPLLINICR